jgi:hypothetical protein
MDISQDEKQYNWLEAAKAYEKLTSGEKTNSLAAENWQKIGSCYDLSSRQAKTASEFKTLRLSAAQAYEKAANLFSADKTSENEGRSLQCRATAENMRSWLAADSSEKVKALDKCRDLAKKTLQTFRDSGNKQGYGEAANLLSSCLLDRL